MVTGQLNKGKDEEATPNQTPVPTARFRNLALKRTQFDITGLGIKKAELKGRDDEDSFAVSLSISCDTNGKQLLGLTKQQLSYLQREQVVLNLFTDTDELYCPTAVELQEYRVPESAVASPIPPTPSFTGSFGSPLPHIEMFLNTESSQVIPETQG